MQGEVKVKIEPFVLERYFARHEFSARYLLSCSDCEALTLSGLLEMADEETAGMWRDLKLAYTESAGHPMLREEVADIYDGLEANDLVVTVPEEGIYLLMHALLEPGDHVVCTFPAYQSLYEVARSLGCEVTNWLPDEERGWRFDPAKLEEALSKPTKLVVVNFPHNPTGYAPTRDEYRLIVDMVRRSGAYFLSDEMYRFLELEPNSTLPSGCEIYDRAFSLFGLSKSFGLPGLRLGWLVSQDRETLEKILELKDYTTICNSAPSEILAIMALRNRDAIIELQIERARRNLGHLDAFINRFADRFSWVRPRGGSVCLPRMIEETDTLAFCDEMVQAAGIMLLPSRMFHYGDHHVRIGFGREGFPEVLDRFGAYLDSDPVNRKPKTGSGNP